MRCLAPIGEHAGCKLWHYTYPSDRDFIGENVCKNAEDAEEEPTPVKYVIIESFIAGIVTRSDATIRSARQPFMPQATNRRRDSAVYGLAMSTLTNMSV